MPYYQHALLISWVNIVLNERHYFWSSHYTNVLCTLTIINYVKMPSSFYKGVNLITDHDENLYFILSLKKMSCQLSYEVGNKPERDSQKEKVITFLL